MIAASLVPSKQAAAITELLQRRAALNRFRSWQDLEMSMRPQKKDPLPTTREAAALAAAIATLAREARQTIKLSSNISSTFPTIWQVRRSRVGWGKNNCARACFYLANLFPLQTNRQVHRAKRNLDPFFETKQRLRDRVEQLSLRDRCPAES